MTKLHLTAALLTLLSLILPATAFSSHDGNQVEQVLKELEINRKLVVEENMALTGDATEFWAVYSAYRSKIEKLDLQSVQLLAEYRDHYDDLTDKRATTILTTSLELRRKKIAIKESYVAKFSSAVTPKLTLRLYQIENKLDAIIQADISAVMPLVE